jgi:beta-glucosidase
MSTETGVGELHAPYRDAGLPVEERVDDLLARMRVEEKVAQLGSAWVFQLMRGEQFAPDRADEICRDGLGQVTRVAGASVFTADRAARIANQIQHRLVEGTRLGIPAIVHEEICSGVMARGSTVFPQAIGVASTFEPELNEAMAAAIRVQMRRAGAQQGLAPVLDVCRDPRWGRTEETYGEDPYLVARMGSAFVRGLQGADLSEGVIATAKHFVGYGASEGALNWAPAHISKRELREVFLHPFEAAVRKDGLRSIMHGYHELDGVPCAASAELMTGILREGWGFDGIVVSDYFAIHQLAVYHHLAADKRQAAAQALGAGIDVELPSTDCFGAPLLSAIEGGQIDGATVDEAVRRILRLKFALGLFEHPYVDEDAALAAVDTDLHRSLAGTVARKSLVLLRNDGVLPLAASPGAIAVIGPNAHEVRHMMGDYSYPAHIESLIEMRDGGNLFEIPMPDDITFSKVALEGVSILDALRARYGEAVRYERGCGVNDVDTSGIAAAVEAATAADVVVLVVGDKAGPTRSCTSGEGRDRSSLDLPGVQEELARAVLATGTPVITVLVAGRPCGSEELHAQSAAVLVAWLPGQEGGKAVGDVLAGACNPGGKLAISFPRSAGQLPVFYGHKVSGGRSHWHGAYVDGPTSPLYPFGFGLSYTRFQLRDPLVATPEVGVGEAVRVIVSVDNVGDVAGEEVVQVYVRDLQASVTRPVLELKSFARVAVDPGASRTVQFDIPIGQLGYYDRDLEYVVEAGEMDILIGSSADELTLAGTVTVRADGSVEKAFDGSRTIV